MGVPAFFRWLSNKYPSVIVYCVEEKPQEVGGIKIPIDSSKPNPNGVEFDNLYLDMNGIIHPCTHPEDKPAPKDEDEMMIAIFECIDRVFSIVRPRKLLYMAIDGVAPRAKMNQQRSRRFRASKESTEKIEEIARLREALLNKGAVLPDEKPKEAHFDSNCITPGTPFMARLSVCLDYYIRDRLNNDPGWKGLKVILSDANVPGEGEHKIMDFIRKQRAKKTHDPNTQHVLCGADADLIMLGLATHEPNFTIIREEFRPNKPKPCDLCHQLGHEMKDCLGCPNQVVEGPATTFSEVPFIFVRLNVLREYLERELTMPNLPFKYDFERVIDDWVFMCFFVGNDFLPHLPSLEIREGAIDRLVNLYKNCVYKTGGFVTDSGDVNLNRVQLILNELGKVEDEIFKKRQQNEIMFKQRNAARKRMALENSDDKPAWIPTGVCAPVPVGYTTKPIINPRQAVYQGRMESMESKDRLESLLIPESQVQGARNVKRNLEEEEPEEEVHDEVRLWEDGFKDRYYESKFDVRKENTSFRVKVAHEYVRGLCWVLRYYYQGCASWKWFFPYHYAPFASDFINIGSLVTTFEKGTRPFKPLEQLMGVFPAASSAHVPKPWATLMHDPYSPIIDFYPVDFKIDLNGKKFAWQGVALLPFVDEKRLFKALEPLYEKLTPEERGRNVCGDDRVYVGLQNSGYKYLKGLYDVSTPITEKEFQFCVDGMSGNIILSAELAKCKGTVLSPVRKLPALQENVVLSARFRNPSFSPDFIFKARRLKGVIEPKRVLKPGNLTAEQSRNWTPITGMVPPTQRASLSAAGHRMMGRYNQVPQTYNEGLFRARDARMYAQVPPPLLRPPFPPHFGLMQNPSYGYSTVGSNNAQRGSYNSRYNSQSSGRDHRGFSNRNQDLMNQDRDGRGFHNRDRFNYGSRGGGGAGGPGGRGNYSNQRGYRR